MIISREFWELHVAWQSLYQQSWWGLRATVVFEPERREWAWFEMKRRSEACRLATPEHKQVVRDHG